MTAFHPFSPAKAVQSLEADGIPHAALLLRDYAAAGLIKTYARALESHHADGTKQVVRDAMLPAGIWQRIVRQGADEQVWSGGTVRLAGSGLVGGEPEVSVTGIGFKPGDLSRLVEHQLGPKQKCAARAAKVETHPDGGEKAAALAKARQRRVPDPSRLAPGVMLLTIADAGAALGIGRTKVNELMKAGRLERVKIDGGVRITAASVRALAEPAG